MTTHDRKTLVRHSPSELNIDCTAVVSSTFRTLRVSLDSVDISLRQRPAGLSGTTCLMLHGFGDGAYVWDRFATMLPATLGVAVPDMRGHGNSSWDPEGAYDLAGHAADIAALLPLLNMERVVLIGHSLGGTIALRLCVILGERLAGLVLVDCMPALDAMSREKIYSDFRLGDRCFASPEEYASWLGERRPLLSPETRREIADSALMRIKKGEYRRRCDPAMANAGRGVSEGMERALATLEHLRCPTLLVRGKVSGVLDRGTLHKMAKASAGESVEVAMAGHAVMVDNPEGFAAVVMPFVMGITTRPIMAEPGMVAPQ